jgi:hypothetical protein
MIRAWIVMCGVALAQGAPSSSALSYEALQKAPAGTWAEYAMSIGTMKATMRYSLVEKSAKALSLEIDTSVPAIVMRMDFAPVADGWTLSRLRMRMGTGPVQDVPVEGAPQVVKKGGAAGTLLGTETLKTPAGSFDCKHYKQATPAGDAEVWISDKVLPAGMVQTTASVAGAKITLSATGTGATAKIK